MGVGVWLVRVGVWLVGCWIAAQYEYVPDNVIDYIIITVVCDFVCTHH